MRFCNGPPNEIKMSRRERECAWPRIGDTKQSQNQLSHPLAVGSIDWLAYFVPIASEIQSAPCFDDVISLSYFSASVPSNSGPSTVIPTPN